MNRYDTGHFPRTQTLSPGDRLLVSRFSYGITPDLVADVSAAGGARAWWERQIAHAYDSPAAIANEVDWWPSLHRTPLEIYKRHVSRVEGAYEVMCDYGRRLMMRRMTTPRQLLEVMTEFWENHFHVPGVIPQAFWRIDYGDVIRAGALGRFDDLLFDAVTHPAMLLFLNAASSTDSHPNENLGRELLELHTVGVGNYSEDDVKSAARILTGWRVDMGDTWQPYYSSYDHWLGLVQVLGFKAANTLADGRTLTRSFLTYLAHHPDTAQRIATKLALQFVSDTPSAALIATLARSYLDNDTAIVPVLRDLIASDEFKASAGRKIREPAADVVATYRVLGAKIHPPKGEDSAANAIYGQARAVGLAPIMWPRPDGEPVDTQSWSSPARVIESMRLHFACAAHNWPRTGVDYPPVSHWFPQGSMAFRDLVDHLSRVLHGRASDSRLLKACCTATGIEAGEKVSPQHPIIKRGMGFLLVVFLDHPRHYER